MSAVTPDDLAIPDLDADARTNAAWHTRFTRDEIQRCSAGGLAVVAFGRHRTGGS